MVATGVLVAGGGREFDAIAVDHGSIGLIHDMIEIDILAWPLNARPTDKKLAARLARMDAKGAAA